MHRIDSFGNNGGLYTNGTPGLVPATVGDADAMNAIQEEIANVIENAPDPITGDPMVLDKEDYTQLLTALVATFGRLAVANTWTGNQTVTGDVDASGTITAATVSSAGAVAGTNLVASGNLTVSGTAAVTGNTSLTTLTTSGAATLASASVTAGLGAATLNVSGTTTLASTFTGALSATGGAGVAGLTAANGTAATGGTRRTALTLTNGDISMAGVAYPTSTTAVTNAITPGNICKAWALVTVSGVGSVTLRAPNKSKDWSATPEGNCPSERTFVRRSK